MVDSAAMVDSTSDHSFLCASHGHCFDGLVSAALLTDLVSAVEPKTVFSYRALGYGPAPVSVDFSANQNALLDYKYVPDPALTFYLDHHPTAFSDAAEKCHFEERRALNPQNFVHDSSSPSCANLVADLARRVYHRDSAQNRELERQAQQIDAAQFPTVEDAIDVSSPLMRVVATVTHFGDRQFYERAIPILLKEGVLGLSEEKWVRSQFELLRGPMKKLNERIRKNGRMVGRVAVIDLLDQQSKVMSKFRQYYEFPQATYSIILSRTPEQVRISIGYNPWSGAACDINIGQICQSYGGGGHAVVGAIGMAEGTEAEALSITQSITTLLQAPL